MKRIYLCGSLAALLLVASLVGCQEQAATAPRPSLVVTKATPEESFALILETFKRGVENVPIGFVLHESDGHTMMTGKNTVSYDLTPPEDGQPYKAVITVDSTSRYSIQRSAEAEEDSDSNDEEPEDSTFDDGAGDDGFTAFDPELVSGPAAADGKKTDDAEPAKRSVSRKSDEEERNYELVYRDGKWILVTELDPETEQSIQNAFDQALGTQI